MTSHLPAKTIAAYQGHFDADINAEANAES